MKETDVCIIGAGPAGYTAAIYAARKMLSVIVIDKASSGGQTANAIWMKNYPGCGRIKGKELMQKMRAQAEGFGAKTKEAVEATDIKKTTNGFEVTTEKGKILAKTVVIATGTKHKHLNIPGEKEFYGKGVSYCANCDGLFFRKQRVAVIGAGNSGATAALLFDEIASETILIEFLPEINCDEIYRAALQKTKVKIIRNTAVTEIFGKEAVEGITLKNRASGKEEKIAVEGVFIYVGLLPENSLAKKIGLKISEKGFIVVNEKLETGIPGIFAAGDITGALAQTVVAAGQGAIAATGVYNFIKGIK